MLKVLNITLEISFKNNSSSKLLKIQYLGI